MVELSEFPQDRSKPRQQPFALWPTTESGPSFAPELFPENIRPTKERTLDRQKNYCKNEDVSDNGSKNMEIHISGRMTRDDLNSFYEVGDAGEPFTMVSATWSGEVLINSIEVDGPNGWWASQNTMLWTYKMDVVSTGSGDRDSRTGIISRGTAELSQEEIDILEGV